MLFNQINAKDIDDWTNKEPRRAQENLPKLVRKLIFAVSDNRINSFNFPSGISIQYSGYDGTLDYGNLNSDEPTDFFPNGKSVWECGTNDDMLTKFNDDIKKRSENPLGVDIKNAAFIFVTSRIWNKAKSIEEVINENKSKYDWKDIRILDANSLEQWLELAPDVSLWFSELIGKHVDGAISVNKYWHDISKSTIPNLTKDFFLQGRENEIETTYKLIDSNGFKMIVSDTSIESSLFFASAVLQLYESGRIKSLDHIIFITKEDEWNKLVDLNWNIILIPLFDLTDEISYPHNTSVFFPVSKYSPTALTNKNISKIEIPKYNLDLFNKALIEFGYKNEECRKIVKLTKCNFMPFYRMISNRPNIKEPKWINEDNIEVLLAAMLAGSWQESRKGDREIIEFISGKPYKEYINLIKKFIDIEDAPIIKSGEKYSCVSINEMWDLLYSKIYKDDINRFKQCVFNVFNTVNPVYELPSDERYLANVIGKEPVYSKMLIEGLIVTIIMFLLRSDDDKAVSSESEINFMVSDILKGIKNCQQWNSIAEFLLLLCEASPSSVLNKLESECREDESDFWKLFKVSKGDFDIFNSNNNYTYIIWTLEKLVWDEENSVRAIHILCKLCEKQFEYSLANTPLNSLYEIFCLWNPQSSLKTEERLQLIKNIVDLYPYTGWELLKKLLPNNHDQICGVISLPMWREANMQNHEGITLQEYDFSVKYIIDECIDMINMNSDKWSYIIENISIFQNYILDLSHKCIDYCKTVNENEVIIICDSLRNRISRFRQFPNQDWSMPETFVIELENIYNEVIPNEINKYKYLFNYNPELLNPIPYNEDTYDYNLENKHLYEIREKAILELIEMHGIDGLIELSKNTEDNFDLGSIITEYVFNNKLDLELLLQFKSINTGLSKSVINALYKHIGLDSLYGEVSKYDKIPNDEKGELFSYFPLSRQIWDNVENENINIQKYYWENISIISINNIENEDCKYLIDKMLQYNRPFSLMDLVAYSKFNDYECIIKILRKGLELIESKENNGISIRYIRSDVIIDLFKKIYNCMNYNEEETAQLELSYIPYFRNNYKPKCLISYLSNNPEDYVRIISKVYKPDEEIVAEVEQDVIDQAKYYRNVINCFDETPGCNKYETDKNKFNSWYERASLYANEVKYSNAFELCYGKLLSYSPIGADGIWPHEIVRSFFESNKSEKVINEFIIGRINQRGIHNLTYGKEENKISLKYKEDAKKIRVNYPIISRILNDISNQFAYDSRREQRMQMDEVL